MFCCTFFGVGALLYTFVLLMDPYDTGRFPGFRIVGTGDRSLANQQLAQARGKAAVGLMRRFRIIWREESPPPRRAWRYRRWPRFS